MQLPEANSAHFPDLFDELDDRKDEFGVVNYGISGASVTKLFLARCLFFRVLYTAPKACIQVFGFPVTPSDRSYDTFVCTVWLL